MTLTAVSVPRRAIAIAIGCIAAALSTVSCRTATAPTESKTYDPTDVIMAEIVKAGAVGGSVNVVESAELQQEVPKTSPAGPRMVRREHLKINNAETEKDFLDLVRGKRYAIAELAVIHRLVAEKKSELERFDERLIAEYDIQPDLRYHYNQAEMTIYRVLPAETNLPSPEAEGAGLNPKTEQKLSVRRPRPVPHRKLKNKNEAGDFIRLTSSKRLTSRQIETLNLLVREKQIELEKYQAILAGNFAISRDRDYQYDPATRILYELVPVPEGASGAGPE